MDETGAHYTEFSKPERQRPLQYTNTYIWNSKQLFKKKLNKLQENMERQFNKIRINTQTRSLIKQWKS